MTKTKTILASALLIGCFTIVGRATAAPVVLKSGAISLMGDSTLHPFASTATLVGVLGEASGALPAGMATLDVTIEVKGLKSGENGLDKNLWRALSADKFPRILFHLSHYEINANSAVHAQGTLSIAGTEKPIELEGVLTPTSDGVRVRGSKELLMTDFGVKPPTLLMGAIKVKDRVVILYDLILGQGKP